MMRDSRTDDIIAALESREQKCILLKLAKQFQYRRAIDFVKSIRRPIRTVVDLISADPGWNKSITKPILSEIEDVLLGNADVNVPPPTQAAIAKAQHKTPPRGEYMPAARTGAWAILIALHQASEVPGYKGYLTKEEIIRKAQGLCDASFTDAGGPGGRTAWKGVDTLTKHGLVIREGLSKKGGVFGQQKDRFKLSPEGDTLARQLLQQPNRNTGAGTSQGGTSSSTPVARPRPSGPLSALDLINEEEQENEHLQEDDDLFPAVFPPFNPTSHPFHSTPGVHLPRATRKMCRPGMCPQQVCDLLQAFLDDSTRSSIVFKSNKDKRRHIHQVVDGLVDEGQQLTHESQSVGTRRHLTVTKLGTGVTQPPAAPPASVPRKRPAASPADRPSKQPRLTTPTSQTQTNIHTAPAATPTPSSSRRPPAAKMAALAALKRAEQAAATLATGSADVSAPYGAADVVTSTPTSTLPISTQRAHPPQASSTPLQLSGSGNGAVGADHDRDKSIAGVAGGQRNGSAVAQHAPNLVVEPILLVDSQEEGVFVGPEDAGLLPKSNKKVPQRAARTVATSGDHSRLPVVDLTDDPMDGAAGMVTPAAQPTRAADAGGAVDLTCDDGPSDHGSLPPRGEGGDRPAASQPTNPRTHAVTATAQHAATAQQTASKSAIAQQAASKSATCSQTHSHLSNAQPSSSLPSNSHKDCNGTSGAGRQGPSRTADHGVDAETSAAAQTAHETATGTVCLVLDRKERKKNKTPLDLCNIIHRHCEELPYEVETIDAPLPLGDYLWVRLQDTQPVHLPADANEEELTAADEGYEKMLEGTRVQGVVVERKTVQDLVARSAGKQCQLKQLRRMRAAKGAVPHQILLVEGVVGSAEHYVVFGGGAERNPGQLVMNSERHVYELVHRLRWSGAGYEHVHVVFVPCSERTGALLAAVSVMMVEGVIQPGVGCAGSGRGQDGAGPAAMDYKGFKSMCNRQMRELGSQALPPAIAAGDIAPDVQPTPSHAFHAAATITLPNNRGTATLHYHPGQQAVLLQIPGESFLHCLLDCHMVCMEFSPVRGGEHVGGGGVSDCRTASSAVAQLVKVLRDAVLEHIPAMNNSVKPVLVIENLWNGQ